MSADIHPAPERPPVSDADKMAARTRERRLPAVTAEDVFLLAELLRRAKHAHAADLAELRQAGVDPIEDWAEWYAEYLLGSFEEPAPEPSRYREVT
jgi:hypothetical protein